VNQSRDQEIGEILTTCGFKSIAAKSSLVSVRQSNVRCIGEGENRITGAAQKLRQALLIGEENSDVKRRKGGTKVERLQSKQTTEDLENSAAGEK